MKLIIFSLSFFIMAIGNAQAQESVMPMDQIPPQNETKTGDVGLGLLVGTPTALNVKFWTTEGLATNINAAYVAGDVALMGDYLWHFRRIAADEVDIDRPAVFSPYIGLGAMFVFDATGDDGDRDRPLYRRTNNEEGVGIGARIPLGLEFMPHSIPAGFFAELAPGTIFTPTNFSFLQAGVGGRYYF